MLRKSELPSDGAERGSDKVLSILLLEGPRLAVCSCGLAFEASSPIEASERVMLSSDFWWIDRAASINTGPDAGLETLFKRVSEPLELVLSDMISSNWLSSMRASEYEELELRLFKALLSIGFARRFLDTRWRNSTMIECSLSRPICFRGRLKKQLTSLEPTRKAARPALSPSDSSSRILIRSYLSPLVLCV